MIYGCVYDVRDKKKQNIHHLSICNRGMVLRYIPNFQTKPYYWICQNIRLTQGSHFQLMDSEFESGVEYIQYIYLYIYDFLHVRISCEFPHPSSRFCFFSMVKQFLTIGFWGTKFVHTTQRPSQQLT